METFASSMITSHSEIHTANETLRKWSDLPKDVLTQIVRNLNPQTDLTRIRGVCPEWRSALPLSEFPPNPETKLPPLEPNSSLVFLVHSRFYFLSPLTPSVDDHLELGGKWVARISDLVGQKRHLYNPFNLDNYFFTTPPISASINLLDCRVSELACVYSLFGYSGDDDDANNTKPISTKVVGGWNPCPGCPFAVLAELQNDGGLVYWKEGDKKWTRMEITESFRVMDIVLHQGKFYVFELSGWRIGVIDPSMPDSISGMEFIPGPKILSEPVHDSFIVSFNGKSYILGDCHLVSSNRKLYLVIEAFSRVNYMKPHKGNAFVLNEDCAIWEHVNSLGDEIFFIGYDASFSLPNSSSNLPQWKPNSICRFTHPFQVDLISIGKHRIEHLDMIRYRQYWRYFSLFDVEDQEKCLTPFRDLCKKTYTGLFFPPPPWVKWQCPSLGNVEVKLDGLEFSGGWEVKLDNVKASVCNVELTVELHDNDDDENDSEEEEEDNEETR